MIIYLLLSLAKPHNKRQKKYMCATLSGDKQHSYTHDLTCSIDSRNNVIFNLVINKISGMTFPIGIMTYKLLVLSFVVSRVMLLLWWAPRLSPLSG